MHVNLRASFEKNENKLKAFKIMKKGADFLIKKTEPTEVFTLNDLSEEQRMMADAATEFVDREMWPYKERFEKKDYAFTEELMKKAGEMGFLGITLPEEYNGMGMDFVTAMLVCDRISGASGSFATAYGAHTGIGIMPIYLYGTDEQKAKFLPKLATGEWIGAYCLTEPGAGSDANNGKTTATLTEDGEHYLINGQKMWISNAGFAHSFVVFAKIEENGKKDKKLSAFLLEYDPENPNGIVLGEEEHKLGIRASSTRQVFFNNTKVHKSMMLGKREEGLKIALNVLNIGRAKLAAGIIDSTRRVLGESIRYANERIQFGQPIISFGAIREKIARMTAKIYTAESAIYRASKDIDDKIAELKAAGMNEAEAEKKAFEEYAIEAAIIKVFVSEMAQEISDEGIQIFGGMGFSEDTPMESFWRDARITRIYEGTNEINRLVTISMLLRKALKGEIDLLSPAKAVAKELTGLPSFDRPDYSQPLTQAEAMIEKMKKIFHMVGGTAVQKLGDKLVYNEQVVMNAADILIGIYTAESALLATKKAMTEFPGRSFETEQAIVDLIVYDTLNKIKPKAEEIIANITDGDERKMLQTGLKRFTKYDVLPDVIALRNKIAEKISKDGRYSLNGY